MIELVDFWTVVRWGGFALLLFYGKRILSLIGGKDGLDKKEICAIALFILGCYMVVEEGNRTDLAHQLYSDVLYVIVFGSSILGFGIKDILKVIQFIGTRGYAKEENGQSTSDSSV